MIWAIGSLAIFGLALLLIGLRGRRTDDHPLCRKCRFDLIGLVPSSPRCPECGADLSTPRALRHGHRKRRRLSLSLGIAILVLFAAATVLAFGSGRWRLRAHLPNWALMVEARASGSEQAAAAVSELIGRYAAGSLPDTDADALARRGLEIQANPSIAWIPTWGDIIEAARRRGRLSKGEVAQYIKNGLMFDAVVRAQASAGAECPLELRAWGQRMGSTTNITLDAALQEIALDDVLIPGAHVRTGLGVGWGGISASIESIRLDGAPGKHTLRSRWRLRAYESFGGDGSTLAEWSVPIVATLELLPPGSHLIRINPDESFRVAIEASINIQGLTVSGPADAPQLTGKVQVSDAPIALAFDILARDASGREWPISTIALPAAGRQRTRHSTSFNAQVPGLTAHQVDIILRASPAVAARTTNLTEIWGGEVVIRAQPINQPPSPAPPADN